MNWVTPELCKFLISFTKEKKRTPRAFLSGAITSRLNLYKKFFNEAEKYFSTIGIEVYNPAVLPITTDWEEAMDITLKELEKSDFIYVLKNWEKSKGVKIELVKAEALGIPIFYQ